MSSELLEAQTNCTKDKCTQITVQI